MCAPYGSDRQAEDRWLVTQKLVCKCCKAKRDEQKLDSARREEKPIQYGFNAAHEESLRRFEEEHGKRPDRRGGVSVPFVVASKRTLLSHRPVETR